MGVFIIFYTEVSTQSDIRDELIWTKCPPMYEIKKQTHFEEFPISDLRGPSSPYVGYRIKLVPISIIQHIISEKGSWSGGGAHQGRLIGPFDKSRWQLAQELTCRLGKTSSHWF